MAEVHKLYAIEEHMDLKHGTIKYKARLENGNSSLELSLGEVGLVVFGDKANLCDLLIVNPVFIGGDLLIEMKPLKVPARKYNINEEIANLIIYK